MPFLPDLQAGYQSRSVIDTFLGFDHQYKIKDGAWFEEQNLTADHFPLFSQRKQRGQYPMTMGAGKLNGIIAKDAVAYVRGNQLIYNQLPVEGIMLTDGPKQLVSMGAYICIFPDAVYLNTKDLTDKGYMGARYSTLQGAEITYTPCDSNGDEFDNVITSNTAPENPANGQYWLDTSGEKHVLKQWSATSSMWINVPTVFVAIESAGIGAQFKEGDGVTLRGIAYDIDGARPEIVEQFDALNADCILQKVEPDRIIIIGMIDQQHTQTSGTVSVERRIPKLDYVCEHDNRLWGCFYGMQGGKMVNEIYACKLGDFRNWYAYAGISTDSYTVSVGSDGEWTGCCAHLGSVLFFKENFIHKLYGNYPSNFQLHTTVARGVQRGSAASLRVVNELLYYKSRSDICAYDGSLPQSVSANFGGMKHYNAVAGTHGGKYYISMQDTVGKWSMYVYDTTNGVWHREDDTHASGFAAWGDELYYIDDDRNVIVCENGTIGLDETPVEWSATSGIVGYDLIDQEYISRFTFRMQLGHEAHMKTEIEYDSSGIWEPQGEVVGYGQELRTFVLPVIPHRCDHFRFRLSGKGDVKIFSMAKLVEQGSDHYER